jgi:hypothetical protein
MLYIYTHTRARARKDEHFLNFRTNLLHSAVKHTQTLITKVLIVI